MRAPSVQSGSSPASFTTMAVAGPSGSGSGPAPSTANSTRRPLGRATSTFSGMTPVTSPIVAALAAADADVPVVHPVRSPRAPASSGSSTHRAFSGPFFRIRGWLIHRLRAVEREPVRSLPVCPSSSQVWIAAGKHGQNRVSRGGCAPSSKRPAHRQRGRGRSLSRLCGGCSLRGFRRSSRRSARPASSL